MLNLSGVYPPLPTSFSTDDSLDVGQMQKNIVNLSETDIAGFLILGSNGELVNLSESERISVYQATRKAIPKNKIMLAGTGAQSTAETLRMSKAAEEAGADAVLVLNPSYYKGLMNRSALSDHYFYLADSMDIPLIIYNMPANSGMDMDAATILELAQHPNIIGLKDSGGNLTKMAEIIGSAPEGFQVLAGSAGFLYPALCLGAVGGILALANIQAQVCVELFRSFQKGDHGKAKYIQESIIQLNTAVTRGWGVPALKAAMDELGLYGGPCRRPIQELGLDQKEQLKTLLKEIKGI